LNFISFIENHVARARKCITTAIVPVNAHAGWDPAIGAAGVGGGSAALLIAATSATP